MDRAALDIAVQRAWPARETVAIGPWTARLDRGVTRRPNSVLPHGAGDEPPDSELGELVAATVDLYVRHGLTPLIQVTEAAWPPRLDERLAACGWTTGIDRTLLLVGPAGPDAAPGVFLEHRPSEEWRTAWWGVDPRGDEQALRVCLDVLGRIDDPVFARVVEGCHTVGVGLGVLVGETLVIECLATVPAARRRRVATRVVGALGAWGASRGALRTVLAVQERNLPARRLYDRLGFERVSSYAYARPAS